MTCYIVSLFIALSWISATHAFECAEYIRRSYDYIVVGSGTAGSVVAGRIAEIPPSRVPEKRRLTVLLIESGESDREREETPYIDTPALYPVLVTSAINWKYLSEPQQKAGFAFNDKRFALPQGRVSGGTFNLNGLIHQRGSRYIFDEWAANGATGWGFDDVLPFFRKSEDIRVPELKNSKYHKSCGPMPISTLQPSPLLMSYVNASVELGYPHINCNEGDDIGICRVQTNIKFGERWTTYKGYINEAKGRTNLDVVTDAHVTKVLIADRKALGIEFLHRGMAFKLRARKEVILSAGTYGTPQILLRSGIGPPSQLQKFKIPPLAHLPVGESLQDHAVLSIRAIVKVPTMRPNMQTEFIKVQQYLYQKRGPLAEIGGTDAILTIDTENINNSYPDLQVAFVSSLPDYDPMAQKALNKKSSLVDSWFSMMKHLDGITFNLKVLHPKSRGHIRLNSTDPFDPPKINPKYLSATEDVEKFLKGIRIIEKLLKTNPMKDIGATLGPAFPGCMRNPLGSDKYWKCYIKHFVESGHNPVSTCKMGSIESNSTVVGPDLIVKGIGGLRIVDASVIPEITDYTNAATIMIAEKAVELIKKG